jgi:hypothetical protein
VQVFTRNSVSAPVGLPGGFGEGQWNVSPGNIGRYHCAGQRDTPHNVPQNALFFVSLMFVRFLPIIAMDAGTTCWVGD